MNTEAPHDSGKGEKPDEFFLLTALVSRRLAYPFAAVFCKLGVSADFVTILGGLSWVMSAVLMVLSGWLLGMDVTVQGHTLLVLSMVLVNLGYILDVADGSVARMTGTSSSRGYFLDYVFHLIFHPMYFCSVGIFLYLITGSVPYLVIGVLSICSGWGASFSAKEHVLCEAIAKGELNPSSLTDEQRYRILIDSESTKQAVSRKRGVGFCIALFKELIFFPGQYSLISALIVLDLVLSGIWNVHFVLLQSAFVAIGLFSIIRVPFRVRREYETLKLLDQIRSTWP